MVRAILDFVGARGPTCLEIGTGLFEKEAVDIAKRGDGRLKRDKSNILSDYLELYRESARGKRGKQPQEQYAE